MKDQSRNLNAHQAAHVARMFWGAEYAAQGGGTMDFWDSLGEQRKRFARGVVKEILAARPETFAEQSS